MKEDFPAISYIKIMKFYRDYNYLINKYFGTKSDWAKHFDASKYKDKNIDSFVTYIINIGGLKHVRNNKHGNPIYQPDEEGRLICQKLLEDTEAYKGIDELYDITRDEKKGSAYI